MRGMAAGSIALAIGLGLAVPTTAITTFLWGTPAWSPPLALALMVAVIWWGIWAVTKLEGS